MLLQVFLHQCLGVLIHVDEGQHPLEHARPGVGIEVMLIGLGVADTAARGISAAGIAQSGASSVSR